MGDIRDILNRLASVRPDEDHPALGTGWARYQTAIICSDSSVGQWIYTYDDPASLVRMNHFLRITQTDPQQASRTCPGSGLVDRRGFSEAMFTTSMGGAVVTFYDQLGVRDPQNNQIGFVGVGDHFYTDDFYQMVQVGNDPQHVRLQGSHGRLNGFEFMRIGAQWVFQSSSGNVVAGNQTAQTLNGIEIQYRQFVSQAFGNLR